MKGTSVSPPSAKLQAFNGFISVPKSRLSRLLYMNPVCLLSTESNDRSVSNVMTISWLTCVDNNGHFFASMNRGRFSWTVLSNQEEANRHFVLSVPVAGMESTVLAIGGQSGRGGRNKFTELGLQTERYLQLAQESKHAGDTNCLQSNALDGICIIGCAAFLMCRVDSWQEMHGHQMLHCTIDSAIVAQSYWQSGKTFCPTADTSVLNADALHCTDDHAVQRPPPPVLGFLGSQSFVHSVCPSK